MPHEPNASNSGVLGNGEGLPPRTAIPPTVPAAKAPSSRQVPPPPKPVPKPPVVAGQKATPAKPAVPPQPAGSDQEQIDQRATAATWQQMAVVYGVSLILHVAVLVILGMIVLPQQIREEIFSVIMKEEKTIEPPALVEPVPEPESLAEQTLEDSPTDTESLVKSDTDAMENFTLKLSEADFQIKPDTTEGPSLPIKVGDISSGRSEAARAQMLQQRGGNEASDAAVTSALQWLASVQRRDGSWDFKDVGKAGDPGNLSSPTGATGLALMAFLGAGHTHTKECTHRATVTRGLNYLLQAGIRRPAGLDFRGESPGNEGMYVQAICATALAEAHGMTEDRRIRPIAQGATDFIVRAQHSGGGWRYKPDSPGDTSVVGWQVMALKSAYHSKIRIPREVGIGTTKFLDDVSHEDGAKYSYMPGQGPKASTTSIGLLCRMYMGWKADHPALVNGVKYLAKVGPSKNDIYYDYYASQVMIQFTGAQGELWDKWNTTLRDWLVEKQIKSGPGRGSWDVIESGHKGERGGRLYTTCLAVMTLEIYYRVLPLYQRAAVEGEF